MKKGDKQKKEQREIRTGKSKKNVKYKDSGEVRVFLYFANTSFYYT